MKKNLMYIGLAVIVIITLLLVFLPKEEKLDLAALKAVAERTTTTPGNNPWDIGDNDVAPTHGDLSFEVITEWEDSGVFYKDVSVVVNINSGYAQVAAISLVVNFDPQCVEVYPLDKTTVHKDLHAALSQAPGMMISNIVEGKFIFAYYCIKQSDFTVNGGVNKLLTLTMKVQSPTMLSFDDQPGQCEFSIDGRNHLSLSLNSKEI